jgi:hypothetical protein
LENFSKTKGVGRKKMSKRPADESKESPSVLKNTKKDDDLLAAIEAEKKRIQEAEDAKWARIRIPFPVLTDAEFDVYVKAIENELATYFASHANENYQHIPILTSSGFQSTAFRTVFGKDSPIAVWHAKMVSFFGSEDEVERSKVEKWIHNCMHAFLECMIKKWNLEHRLFYMKWNSQGSLLVYYIKN